MPISRQQRVVAHVSKGHKTPAIISKGRRVIFQLQNSPIIDYFFSAPTIWDADHPETELDILFHTSNSASNIVKRGSITLSHTDPFSVRTRTLPSDSGDIFSIKATNSEGDITGDSFQLPYVKVPVITNLRSGTFLPSRGSITPGGTLQILATIDPIEATLSMDENVGTITPRHYTDGNLDYSHHFGFQGTRYPILTARTAQGTTQRWFSYNFPPIFSGGTSPATINSFTIDKAYIASGESVVFTWSVTNATSVKLIRVSDNTTLHTATGSGTYTISNITASETYKLEVARTGGKTLVEERNIVVYPSCALAISATPSIVRPGGTATISFSATNAKAWRITGAGTGIEAGGSGPASNQQVQTEALNTGTYTIHLYAWNEYGKQYTQPLYLRVA